ncbi:MAG: tRNA preQ1(34) S-adenosylmethionine ribosyltransferase-isomerase QueA [Steroidobacteraceae bacterium]
MRRSDFDFQLPPELIAQAPLAERSGSRLLCLDGASGQFTDRLFRELPGLLRTGDLLVFNDTRVLPARLKGRKPTGGAVEIFLERPLPGCNALVQLRASKGFRDNDRILTAGGLVTVLKRRDDLWEIELPQAAVPFFTQHGSVPLPPYIARDPHSTDLERYQSVLARVPGAVAAPTASLHFDAALLVELERLGLERALLTLHVGAGTFQPLRSEDLSAHRMHSEWYEVSTATVQAVRAARAAGRRVIAVGTTVARALESAAAGGELHAGGGETALFVYPGYRFRVIDGLITNFHLPQSTLLMLVSAFAGREAVLAAYAHAVRQRYRFFSYGDAMLVWPAAGVHA